MQSSNPNSNSNSKQNAEDTTATELAAIRNQFLYLCHTNNREGNVPKVKFSDNKESYFIENNFDYEGIIQKNNLLEDEFQRLTKILEDKNDSELKNIFMKEQNSIHANAKKMVNELLSVSVDPKKLDIGINAAKAKEFTNCFVPQNSLKKVNNKIELLNNDLKNEKESKNSNQQNINNLEEQIKKYEVYKKTLQELAPTLQKKVLEGINKAELTDIPGMKDKNTELPNKTISECVNKITQEQIKKNVGEKSIIARKADGKQEDGSLNLLTFSQDSKNFKPGTFLLRNWGDFFDNEVKEMALIGKNVNALTRPLFIIGYPVFFLMRFAKNLFRPDIYNEISVAQEKNGYSVGMVISDDPKDHPRQAAEFLTTFTSANPLSKKIKLSLGKEMSEKFISELSMQAVKLGIKLELDPDYNKELGANRATYEQILQRGNEEIDKGLSKVPDGSVGSIAIKSKI